MAELQAKVKQYEGKLAALSAINSALQKENDQLQQELEEQRAAALPGTDAEEELFELKEEFGRRLGEQQRAIDVLKDDKSRLLEQLRTATSGGSATEAKVAQLEDTLVQLQQERQQLHRAQSQQEPATKKLRLQAASLEAENEKLQGSCRALEQQLQEAQAAHAAAAQSAAAATAALESTHQKAHAQRQQLLADAKREAEAQLAAERSAADRRVAGAAAAAEEREADMGAQLAEARLSLQALREVVAAQEEGGRKVEGQLRERVRALEAEKEELAAGASDASRPLLRQIEALSSQLAAAQASAANADWATQARLRQAEATAASALDGQREAVARATAAESALQAARDAAVAAAAATAELRAQLAAVQRRVLTLEAERNASEERLTSAVAREREAAGVLERFRRESGEKLWEAEQKLRLLTQERDQLQQQLATAAAANAAAGKAASVSLVSAAAGTPPVTSQPAASERLTNGHSSAASGAIASAAAAAEAAGRAETGSETTSPAYRDRTTTTAAEASSSLASLLSQPSLTKHTASSSGRSSDSAGDTARLRRAVERLQRELATAVSERDSASEQLLAAMKGAEGAEALRRQLQEVQNRADVALEIIGERTLRIEELEADVAEMKQVFREQLEECVAQLQAAQKQRPSAEEGDGIG